MGEYADDAEVLALRAALAFTDGTGVDHHDVYLMIIEEIERRRLWPRAFGALLRLAEAALDELGGGVSAAQQIQTALLAVLDDSDDGS